MAELRRYEYKSKTLSPRVVTLDSFEDGITLDISRTTSMGDECVIELKPFTDLPTAENFFNRLVEMLKE